MRNNNPLNIRKSKIHWLGLKKHQDDPSFCQFENVIYGYRAAFRLMRTYYHQYSLHTINDIINRFAPCTENDTSSYIDFVCDKTGLTPDQQLLSPENDFQTWCNIILAMSKIESKAPSSHLSYVLRAWHLAFSRQDNTKQTSF